jgi:hypothetical protein
LNSPTNRRDLTSHSFFVISSLFHHLSLKQGVLTAATFISNSLHSYGRLASCEPAESTALYSSHPSHTAALGEDLHRCPQNEMHAEEGRSCNAHERLRIGALVAEVRRPSPPPAIEIGIHLTKTVRDLAAVSFVLMSPRRDGEFSPGISTTPLKNPVASK